MRSKIYLFMCFPLFAMAQTGPGGVGDSSTNIFWLDADQISGHSDGDDLFNWPDKSGNGMHLSQPVLTLTPEYRTAILNGHPVVRFNKTSGTYGRLRRTGLSNFPSSAITQFIVNANTGESNDGLTSYASSAGNNDFLIFNSANLSIYRGAGIAPTSVSSNDGSWHIINPSWRSADGDTRLWLDGTEQFASNLAVGSTITSNGCFALAGEQDAIDANYDANQAHLGDFAEVLVYNFRLNRAQRIIVNNYLAAKYLIPLSGNDYFAYELTHGNDVAGIGRESLSEIHTAAMSDGILQVSNPAGLNTNQEYLLFGHDGQDVNTSWTTTEAPGGGVTVQRLAREWRFSEVNGDVGTLDVTVDVATLPALPSGFSSYSILVDADGDFSNGATIYELGHDIGTFYKVLGLNIADGAFIAIGTIDCKVNFTSSFSSGFEPFDALIEVQLDYIPFSDVTVHVSSTDGSALASQPDYVALVNSALTIAAGTMTETFTVTIVDEGVIETDETFRLSLSSPSAGVDIGSTSTHTYTIHDDDNARKVYFSSSISSVSEGSITALVTIEISTSSATDVSVDYTVNGGTATPGLGNDYLLPSGTITIPGGSGMTSATLSITINDDTIYEHDETIIIRLSNPVACNLDLPSPGNVGTGFTRHTLTIHDNDSPPNVQFSSVGASGLESASPISIALEIDALSSVDAMVTYTVTDVTANNPSDYILNAGTATIPAGMSTVNLIASIVDNSLEELPETFRVTLVSATDATLGINIEFVYQIIDEDLFGHTGPGGVGNAANNKLWLSADEGIYRDAGATLASAGDPVQEWHDRSGNAHDLSQPSASFRPIFMTNAINGLPAMQFSVDNNRIRRTGFSDFPTDEITTISVSNTSQGNDALVSYATNADNNNYLLFNSSNQTTHIAGGNAASGQSYADGNWHILGHTWTSAGGANTLYRDGTQVYSGTLSSGRPITPGGCLALGGEQDAVDGGYSALQDFDGSIGETIIYNLRLNIAQRIIVDNYLAAKYGMSIANDLFAHESLYGHEVAGIGRVSITDFHQDAQGTAIVRISRPDDLENGEFLIWGHDDGLEQAIETVDIPISVEARFQRVWRVSEVNQSLSPVDVGAIDMSWDLSGHGPVTVTDLRLLIDTDNDGLFADETPIAGAISSGAGIYQFRGVNGISDNTRFTLGTIELAQTPLPIELLSFTANVTGEKTVKMEWLTASEINNDYFSVERSRNGLDFEPLLHMDGAGNSSSILAYTAYDLSPFTGLSYYRLKQTDFDGQFSYSEIRAAFIAEEVPISFFPNPCSDFITVIAAEKDLNDIGLFNALGQEVTPKTNLQQINKERMVIDLSLLDQGIYFLRIGSQVHTIYKE